MLQTSSLGLRWQVGNGSIIRVFKDPWLARPHSFKPITRPNENDSDIRVNELVNLASGEWSE